MDCANPKESTVAGLPADVLAEIHFRLPIKSLLRFRCVSRAWRDLIDDPLLRTRFPQTLRGFLLVDEAIHGSIDGGHFGFANLQLRPLDIDRSFSFLTSLPGVEILSLSDSCNGLLLFENSPGDPMLVSGYFVCNPATKGWGEVPTCNCSPPAGFDEARYTYLLFDPAASDHFHLVQFWDRHYQTMHDQFYITVHAYSSETRTWSCSDWDWKTEEEQGQLEWWRHQGLTPYEGPRRTFVNGMLHFVILDQYNIVAVDVQGKTRRIIPVPAMVEEERWLLPGHVAESHGRLHYINHEPVAHDSEQSPRLYIWVLNDYDAQEWVLVDTVSLLELFGEPSTSNWNFRVTSIHPDRNVVFFVISGLEAHTTINRKLISYDMGHKEVSVVVTFENERRHRHVVPYVPCFAESLALTNMH